MISKYWTNSLYIHIRMTNNGINVGLPPKFIDVLHPFLLNLSNRIKTGKVFSKDFSNGTRNEISDGQCNDSMLQDYSTIQDICHLDSKDLFHQLLFTLLLECLSC